MSNINELLNLPLETLSILAAGYLGYWVSSVGHIKHLKATDIIFKSLFFALIAKLAFTFSQNYLGGYDLISVIFSGFIAVFAALLWRKWGSKYTADFLRWLNIVREDGMETALGTIRGGAECMSQVVIRKTDGTQLMCSDLMYYAKKPHGPLLMGEDGSIALYIDRYRETSDDEWETINPINKECRISFTYIPKTSIEEIEFRYL